MQDLRELLLHDFDIECFKGLVVFLGSDANAINQIAQKSD
jgi:hypothetical protein